MNPDNVCHLYKWIALLIGFVSLLFVFVFWKLQNSLKNDYFLTTPNDPQHSSDANTDKEE